jgi:hypothetical protein
VLSQEIRRKPVVEYPSHLDASALYQPKIRNSKFPGREVVALIANSQGKDILRKVKGSERGS